jgi:hypothetical protein
MAFIKIVALATTFSKKLQLHALSLPYKETVGCSLYTEFVVDDFTLQRGRKKVFTPLEIVH